MSTYLVTGFDESGEVVQYAVTLDETDTATRSAIACVTKASARMWWRQRLPGVRVSSVKRLAGYVALGAA